MTTSPLSPPTAGIPGGSRCFAPALIAAFLAHAQPALASGGADPVDMVDVFIGTGGEGHTYRPGDREPGLLGQRYPRSSISASPVAGSPVVSVTERR